MQHLIFAKNSQTSKLGTASFEKKQPNKDFYVNVRCMYQSVQYRNWNRESRFQIEYRNREMKIARTEKFSTQKCINFQGFLPNFGAFQVSNFFSKLKIYNLLEVCDRFPGSKKLWNCNFPEPGMKKYRELDTLTLSNVR